MSGHSEKVLLWRVHILLQVVTNPPSQLLTFSLKLTPEESRQLAFVVEVARLKGLVLLLKGPGAAAIAAKTGGAKLLRK